MSKHLQLHTAILAAFTTIGFEANSLSENPEALAEFMAAQQVTGGEDLKARIATLEAEAATHVAALETARDRGDQLHTQLTEAQAAITVFENRSIVYAKGVVDSGVKLEAKAGGAEHTSEDIATAIKASVATRAAEKLAAMGHEGALLAEASQGAGGEGDDNQPKLTGSDRTAAALRARREAK